MMQEPDARLLALAAAVLDGTPVDWDAAVLEASDEARPFVEHLRLVAAANPLCCDDTRPEPPPLKAGDTWGPLRLTARLGAGSSGEVWKAWDSRLERDVALKLLPEAHAGPADARAVIHEGRLLARVRHPQVVTIHGAEAIDGRIGLWMELVEGDDLETLLGTSGPFTPHDVARIGVDVCHALHAVHEAGVLHRDVKAQNVRRTPDGRIVLMDFGSGRDLDVQGPPAHDLLGTPLYLAPEVFAGGPATRQSDIYSVGVLLFHLLTGGFPVTGRRVRDIAEGHRQGTVTTVRSVRRQAPRSLARVIERALARDPAQRFARADELAQALTIADPRRRIIRVMSAAAISLVLTAAVGSGMWLRSRSSDGSSAPPGSGIVQRQLRPPFSPGVMGGPSPDGRLLSYADRSTGNLAIVDLTANSVRMLTSDADIAASEYAVASTFSADSRSVAYSWLSRDCTCAQLRTIRVDTGERNTVTTYTGIDEVLVTGWSRDGRYVATWVNDNPQRPDYALELFDLQAGTRKPIGRSEARLTGFSPDGRFIAYSRASRTDARVHDIVIAAIETGHPEAVIDGPGQKTSPQWSSDGAHLLFLNQGSGTVSLWAQPVQAGSPSGERVLISKNIGSVSPLGLTDGGSYYYLLEGQATDVMVARVDAATGRVLEPAQRAASSAGASESPDWSHDGRFLAWRTVPQPFSLVVREVATGEERTLTSVVNVGPTPRWSPDGRSLLVRAGEANARGLYIVDVESGGLRGPFLKGRPVGEFAWKAGGRGAWILDFRRGVTGLEVVSGKETRLFSPRDGWSHGRGLALSPDGQRLAAVLLRGSESVLTIIPVNGGAPHEILRLQQPDVMMLGDWTRDGSALMYIKARTLDGQSLEPVRELWAVGIDGGTPRSLNVSSEGLQDVRMHPDGERIAFKSGGRRRELWVLENTLSAMAADASRPGR